MQTELDKAKCKTFSSKREVKKLGKDEEKGKAEKAAEKTGEVVGKGVKKGFGVVKEIGSGIKKGVKGDEKKEKE